MFFRISRQTKRNDVDDIGRRKMEQRDVCDDNSRLCVIGK